MCGFSLFTTDNTPQNPTTLLSFALSLLLLPFHYIPLPRERVMLIEFMLFSACLFTRVHTHALSQNSRAYLCMLCLRKPVRCIYCYTGFCFFIHTLPTPHFQNRLIRTGFRLCRCRQTTTSFLFTPHSLKKQPLFRTLFFLIFWFAFFLLWLCFFVFVIIVNNNC